MFFRVPFHFPFPVYSIDRLASDMNEGCSSRLVGNEYHMWRAIKPLWLYLLHVRVFYPFWDLLSAVSLLFVVRGAFVAGDGVFYVFGFKILCSNDRFWVTDSKYTFEKCRLSFKFYIQTLRLSLSIQKFHEQQWILHQTVSCHSGPSQNHIFLLTHSMLAMYHEC